MAEPSMSFEEAIEHVGFGRFQRRLMIICGLGWAADAMEVLLIAFALPAIADRMGLTTPSGPAGHSHLPGHAGRGAGMGPAERPVWPQD
jgi:MFS transporter, putative metabolite:H+ symporter